MADFSFFVTRKGDPDAGYLGWDDEFVEIGRAIEYPTFNMAKEVADDLTRRDHLKGDRYDVRSVYDWRSL